MYIFFKYKLYKLWFQLKESSKIIYWFTVVIISIPWMAHYPLSIFWLPFWTSLCFLNWLYHRVISCSIQLHSIYNYLLTAVVLVSLLASLSFLLLVWSDSNISSDRSYTTLLEIYLSWYCEAVKYPYFDSLIS